MSYTVSFQSKIYLSDAINSMRSEFNLPLTELKAPNNAQYPSKFSFIIPEGMSATFDLANIGFNMRAFAIKASRPVAAFLTTTNELGNPKEYELPLGTYASYLFDSKESEKITHIQSIRVEVPPASTVTPSPPPPNYPDAFVDLFVLMAPASN